MLPPIHLRIFVRDLAIMIKYSGDGDICQALFEDFILHADEKNPPLKRGHYTRNESQMRLCMEYIDFCNQLQQGAITYTDPLFPLSPDSSRFVYNIPAKVDGVDNISPKSTSLDAFWASKLAAG